MSGRGSGGCEGGGEPGSRRRSARNTSKARQEIAKQEGEHQKRVRAEKAKKAREKKKRKASADKANSRGNKQKNKKMGAAAFPGDGRQLNGDPTTTSAVPRLGGSSVDNVYAKDLVGAKVLGLMTMIQQGDQRTRGDLRKQVDIRETQNLNLEKMTALCSKDFAIKEVKGGDQVDGGILLGKKGDYEDSSASGKNGKDAIEPDTLCRATYYTSTRNKRVEEDFKMMSKEDVAVLIKGLFDDELWRDYLSEERFPTYKDAFWSMAYQYVSPNDEIEGLDEIYKEICAKRDWESIKGVGKRNAKRGRA